MTTHPKQHTLPELFEMWQKDEFKLTDAQKYGYDYRHLCNSFTRMYNKRKKTKENEK